MNTAPLSLPRIYFSIRTIGVTNDLDEYEKRKLAIFNILNCMAIFTGFLIPVAGLFNDDNFPPLAWIAAVSPAVISAFVLLGVYKRKYEQAKMVYFIFYPFLTSLAYASKIDIGIELFFFVYGVLAVFLLKRILHAIVAFCFSAFLYCIVALFWNDYEVRLVEVNPAFFVFNHILAVIFIFSSLYLFKTENNAYLASLSTQNMKLAAQKEEIEKQAAELKELDHLKNKLFSVIAHDLKTPMYALRNLFRNMQQYDLPAEEVKLMIPDVVTDLNYTTGLMENLLHWAKCKMQSQGLKPQLLDISILIREVVQLLRLQADAKKVYLETKIDQPVYIYADKDMVSLVLRNLLSNAIKFTPENGKVCLGAIESSSFVEVFVQDTGTGMTEETIKQINANNYFTTKGTANEAGTGLGLMLCKEFLAKNGGRMFVESEAGKGSVFSFTLPAAN